MLIVLLLYNTKLLLAGTTGLEPATFCVTGRRSNQAELRPQQKILNFDMYQGRDLNSRPRAYESRALTN